ncbi:hypothetical protein MIR68_008187 [Amoeboaphelidium protococcarum]|nr:hypothetical protein MIR68_008187 [Amoeboaphelidium protococcarum]
MTVKFRYILAWRLLNALLIQTYFSPDEYYQAIEPAYLNAFYPEQFQDFVSNKSFQQGFTGLTWEWSQQIRSPVMVYVLSLLYQLLELVNLDSRWMIIHLPKLLSALISSVGEYYSLRFISKYIPSFDKNSVLIIHMCWWYQMFTSGRYLSNIVEQTLTTVALSYWPWNGDYTRIYTSVTIALISFCIRPTSPVIWIYLFILLLIRNVQFKRWFQVVTLCSILGVIVLSLSTMLDTIFYSAATSSLYNFIQFNLIQNLSSFYGVHSPLWYITSGLPTIMLTYAPFAYLAVIVNITGVVQREGSTLSSSLQQQQQILLDCTWCLILTVGMLSLVQHKEFRFLSSLYLPLMLLSLQGVYMVLTFIINKKGARRFGKTLFWFIILVQLIAGLYFALVHQRGVLDLMDVLHQDREQMLKQPEAQQFSVLFAMPCHSTPWFSMFHRYQQSLVGNSLDDKSDDLPRMRYLTCVPPLNGDAAQMDNYQDETDVFYQDPAKYLNALLSEEFYSHVVLFKDLESEAILSILRAHKYQISKSIFNSHFHDDSRRHGDIIVYQRQTK